MDVFPPKEVTDWIALQEQVQGTAIDDRCRSITNEIDGLIRDLFSNLSGHALSDVLPYRHRVWCCLEYHWRSFAESGRICFADVVRRIERGELKYGVVGNNVLSDVVLAVWLEEGKTGAVERFESDYMPIVSAVARRIGSQSAVDCLENFAAELVIPRANRPPRIRTYQGRTPLTNWLRSVVVNFWTSEARKLKVKAVSTSLETGVYTSPQQIAERTECTQLLQPLFRNIATSLDSEDRLLIQMLILDDVPQKDVARAFRLNSGTITRRRQRISRTILSSLQMLAAEHEKQRHVTDCLQLALADGDDELRLQLADSLAQAVRHDSTMTDESEE